MVRTSPILAALALLSACTSDDAALPASRAAADALPTTAATPPPVTETHADGTCWAREKTPAIYEQVMGEIQVVQAELAEDGTMLRPPIYRKAPVPKLVQPRGEMTFEAPCPDTMTPDFIASVQRALAARAYYGGEITGVIDLTTAAAIRRYQSERGLESGQLSLETARALGLIAVELSEI
jgi:hypothetical protein